MFVAAVEGLWMFAVAVEGLWLVVVVAEVPLSFLAERHDYLAAVAVFQLLELFHRIAAVPHLGSILLD